MKRANYRVSPGRGQSWPWHAQEEKPALTREQIQARNVERAKRRLKQKRADNCETIARNQLMARGFVAVEQINTKRTTTGKCIKDAAGDCTFQDPRNGRAGLMETKSHDKDALWWSDIEDHQRKNLDRCAANHGHAVLCWIGPHGIAFLDWPKLRACGFTERTSIGPMWLTTCRWNESVPYTPPPRTFGAFNATTERPAP